MTEVIEILILGVVTGFVSYTVTRGSIFDPLRDWFFHRSVVKIEPPGNTLKRRRNIAKVFKFMNELLSCPYCFSHWVAFLFVFLCRPVVTDYGMYIDYPISAFLIIAVSSFTWGAFEKLTS